MKKPDFFIVGAPRCGTTALCQYLDEHPEIYISKPKEPCFFDHDLSPTTLKYKEYLELFEPGYHQLCGEGSTWYLFSTPKPVSSSLVKCAL